MRKLILALTLIMSFTTIDAQRINITTQLEKAPLGDTYMATTNPSTGKQEYVTVSSVFAGGGSGDIVQSYTYDGDILELTTNLTTLQATVNSGSIHSVGAITVDGTTYPAGTDIQTILLDIATNGGESTTVSTPTPTSTVALSITGSEISAEVPSASITPTQLDRAYLEVEQDADPTNEIQTIAKSNGLVTLSDSGGSFIDEVDDADADPTNEIELPIGGASGQVLQTDGSGAYTWVDQTTDTDTQLTEAEVDAFANNNGYLLTEVDGSTTNEIELPTGGVSGQVLNTDGSGNYSWVDQTVDTDTQLDETEVDAFVANNGYLLTELDGDPANEIELPAGGNANDVLTTDGAGNYTWTAPAAGGGSTEVYQSGSALIKADGLGVTYSLSGNVGTVTIPAGVRLDYIRVNESSTSIGNATDFTLKITDNNADVNQGTVTDYMPPISQFIKRDNLNNDPPNITFPFINTADAPPTPQMQITNYGGNSIDLTYKNVDSFTEWTVIANY